MENDNQNNGIYEKLPTVCSACGSVVDSSEWQLTRTAQDEDGTPQLHVFCDEQCLDQWQ